MAKRDRTMTDHLGNQVPARYVDPVDRERDRVVRRLHKKAEKLNCQLADFRAECLETIESFLAWETCQDNSVPRGIKGNVSLPSFDGTLKVTRARQPHIDFDERLQAAQELIREHIRDKAQGIDQDIQVIIDDAFDGTNGRLSTVRIFGLLKLKIRGPKWNQAMDMIRASIRVTGSREYARFYKRPEGTGSDWEQIPLDIARA
jgi:hypothetical protein